MLTMRRRWLGMLMSPLLLVGCDENPAGPSGTPSFRTTDTPAITSASAVSSSQIDVAWNDNSTNETGFELQRSTGGPSGAFEWLTSTGPGVSSYSDQGLAGNTQYCYRTRAFRTTGRKTTYSDFSNTACATTPVPPPPPGPAAPSGTNARPASSTAVQVTWVDNSSDETGFRVEFSLDAGATWNSTGYSLSSNSTTFRHWGRTSDQTVCYRVIADNGLGSSSPSNVDCTAPPFAPTDLAAAGVTGPAIDLTWTPKSEVADGYHIERAGPDNVWATIADLPANASQYHDAGVTAGTRYWYRLAAAKDGGYSDFLSISAVASSELPAPPTSASVAPGGSTFASVNWVHDLTNVDGFIVERSIDGGASWPEIGRTPWHQTWFGDPSVESEREVCYRVRATNGAGPSAPSPEACTVPPAGPTGLAATAVVGGAGIDLTWTDHSSFEDGYEVYRLFTDCNYYSGCYSYYASIMTLGRNAASYRDEAVTPGETHWYFVVARRDGGTSNWSNEASAVAPYPPR